MAGNNIVTYYMSCYFVALIIREIYDIMTIRTAKNEMLLYNLKELCNSFWNMKYY